MDTLEQRFNSDKQKYGRYFDPNLIFRIKLTQNVSDDSFRAELRRAGIQTIASASSENGYLVVFASDVHLAQFRQKLEYRSRKNKATFVDAIDEIEEIPQEDKLGESLKKNGLQGSDTERVDVEIWRMKDEPLSKFVAGLRTFVEANNGEATDILTTEDFCVVRIRLDQNLLDIITRMREVAHADRPAVVSVEKQLESDIQEMDVKGPPLEGQPGILVVDSGILDHPLLQDSIADRIVLPEKGGKIVADVDDVGHGTQVAGIALYGDISRCVEASFDPQLWLYSAKVMYNDDGYAVFDKDELLEHQFKDAVERTIQKHDNCRVINVSLGNSANRMYGKQRQFRLASLIDELSFQHKDILFTVAAGNSDDDVGDLESYPKYLLEESMRVKVIDPATSAHALTVGAAFLLRQPDILTPLVSPSPFTRVGPGLNGMIKPELIEYGGGYHSDLLTINPRWVREGRLFTLDRGTSLSAPKVAHYLAMLEDSFPSTSRNMIKALVLSSASIPQKRHPRLNELVWGNTESETQKILNLHGYGMPDLNAALASNANRVLLRHDGKISLDRVHFFAVMVPDEFLETAGRRSIELVLVFDPPTNRNRADYLGVMMNLRLFKDLPLETVQRLYTESNNDDNSVPNPLRNKQIALTPSHNIRNKGVHQKAIKEWSSRPRFKTSEPLVLAVTCQKRWYVNDGYEQPYAVVMTIKHEKAINLYDPIKLMNQIRIRVKSQA